MRLNGSRLGWRHPVVLIVGIATVLLLVVPFASAKQATPEASPAASPVASPVASSPVFKTRDDAKLGTILTDSDGRTVYQYADDLPGMSNCIDKCAANWPPVTVNGSPELADGVPGSIALTLHTDTDSKTGYDQVVYNGHPLYYFKGDVKPGDTNGNGIAGKWSVVHPSSGVSTPVASPAASPAATPGA